MQKKRNPKIGVVIVTFNSENHVLKCIASVYGNNYKNLSVVVVDNNSNDNTISAIKKNYKNIHIVKNNDNLGFAKGCNQGIKFLLKHHTEYVLLLNPDTLISKSFLKKMLIPFDENKKIFVAGSIITYMKNPKKIWYAGGYLNKIFLYTRHKYMDKHVESLKIKSGITDFITGACMMIRGEAIKKIGLLPEDYFLYFEDIVFCKKIIDEGFSCYLLAEPLVRHDVSASTGIAGSNNISSLKAYYFARNPLLYIKANTNSPKKILQIIGQFIIRFPYYLFFMLRMKSVQLIFSYLRGLRDGLIGKEGYI